MGKQVANGDLPAVAYTVDHVQPLHDLVIEKGKFGEGGIQSTRPQRSFFPHLQQERRGHRLGHAGQMKLMIRCHRRIRIGVGLAHGRRMDKAQIGRLHPQHCVHDAGPCADALAGKQPRQRLIQV